jgi:hypothetical protein
MRADFGANNDHVYITNIIAPINNLLVQAPVVKLNYFFTISALPQSVTIIAIYVDMPVKYNIHCTHLFFYYACISICYSPTFALSKSINLF